MVGSFGSMEEIAQYALDTAQDGDLLITMGCGDVNKVNKMILDQLREKEEKSCK